MNIHDGKWHMVTSNGKQTKVDGKAFFMPSRLALAIREVLYKQ